MDDKKKNNILDELFTDSSNHLDPKELLDLLKPFIGLNRGNNEIIFTPKGVILKTNKKIILIFLAKKVLYLLAIISTELVKPKEIKEEFKNNIPGGTIDATIKRLADKGILKNSEGGYFIPDFNFPIIKRIFTKEIK